MSLLGFDFGGGAELYGWLSWGSVERIAQARAMVAIPFELRV